MKKSKLVTVKDLSMRFKCTRQYLNELIKKNKIKPDYFIAGAYFFTIKKADKIAKEYFSYTL